MTPLPTLSSSGDSHAFKADILAKLTLAVGKDPEHANARDWLIATSLAVRDRLALRWMKSTRRIYKAEEKRVYYLSMEYLTGRTLANALVNLGLLDESREGLAELKLNLDELIAAEWEAGLGNGGLGRLAACLLDSMATLGLPGYGYGIRYEYGIFQQRIEDLRQSIIDGVDDDADHIV